MPSGYSTSTKGIVLSKEAFGEADLYIQFLTKDFGIINTLAKSAKKSKRRYIGGLDIFCHDEIFLRGDPKERPYLVELSVLNAFSRIRDSLEKLLVAGETTVWIKKLANTVAYQPYLYSLLGQTLATIEKEENIERLELLMLLFKLKLIHLLGIKPHTESCAQCGTILSDDVLFDFAVGGVVCRDCSHKIVTQSDIRLDSEERLLVSLAETIRWSDWPHFSFSNSKVPRLQKVIKQFTEYHTHLKI